MDTRLRWLCLVAFSLLVVSSLSAPVGAAGGNQAPGVAQAGSLAVVDITTTVHPVYTVFNPTVAELVNANVTLTGLGITSPTTIQLANANDLTPRAITAQAVLQNGTVVPLRVSLVLQTAGDTATIILPNSTASATVSFTGDGSGESFLGRYVATVPFIQLTGLGELVQYNDYLVLPATSKITVAYDSLGHQVPFQALGSSTQGSYTTIRVSSALGTVIVESRLFFPISLALSISAAVTVVLVAVAVLRRKPLSTDSASARPQGPSLIPALARRGAEGIRSLGSGSISLLFGRSSDPRFPRQSRPQGLLILFVLCGVLMVSLGALAGPSPAVKAYVIASPSQTTAIQTQLQSMFGNVQVVTPAQDYSDFNVMSSVGMFDMVIVSNYPSTGIPEVSKFVVPNLQNVPVLVLDQTADPTFAAQLEAMGSSQTFVVANAAQLNASTVQTISSTVTGDRTTNIVGLQISNRGFNEILATEGLLSLILVLLGWAYLGASVSQMVGGPTLARVALFIASGVFVFFFAEVVYVVTSSALRVPISLHAVISGSRTLTATGEMGAVFHLPLGGGSTPRLVAGVFGVLFGAFIATESKVFNKKSLVLISAVALVLLVNPFTFGQYTFEGLLLFLGNITFGTAYAGSLTFKGILYGFGTALGGNASSTYLLSAGKILYFTGLVPLAFIGRMGRTTASVALLLAALFIGDGGVRVGEMTPDKTVIAVMPGLVVGFGIGLLLLMLSSAEKWLVASYDRAQP